MTAGDKHDRDLDAYLKGDSALSGAYRASFGKTQPSASLDAVILRESRQSLRRQGAWQPFAANWMAPASLAAVLVLAIGLVTFMDREPDVARRPLPAAAPSLSLPEKSIEGRVSSESEAQRRSSMVPKEATEEMIAPARKPPAASVLPESQPPADSPAPKTRELKSPVGASGLRKREKSLDDTAAGDLGKVGGHTKEEPAEAVQDGLLVQQSFPERFAIIQSGMSAKAVHRLLGEPAIKTDQVWSYRPPSIPGTEHPLRVYRVFFSGGVVERIEVSAR